MNLKRARVNSGGSRKIIKLYPKLILFAKFKKLSYTQKSLAGRGASGSIVVRTKSKLSSRLVLKRITYKWRQRIVGFVAVLEATKLNNKLTSLTFLSSGGVAYFPLITRDTLCGIRYFNTKSVSLRSLLDAPTFAILHTTKILTKISLIELMPGSGAQYARASGCFGKLIKIDDKAHLALVQLPSGVKKIFSVYGTTALGPVGLKMSKFRRDTKAGNWRRLGRKPITRGVARNPVDHPHGGRTKSIKYPRTPWGLTTKFK